MKKIKILAALVAVCLTIGLFSGCSIGDNTVLANVDGAQITKAEFALYLLQIENNMLSQAGISTQDQAEAYWQTEVDGKNAVETAKDTAMEQVILTKLKCLKAEELNVSLTDEEKESINQQIGSQISEMGGRSVFQAELKNIGTNEDAYIAFMEDMYLASKVDSALSEMPEYSVSEDEARENVKNTYIRAKHILISTVDATTGAALSDEEKAEAKAKADDIYKQISDGADFDTLMNENSQDPGLANSPDGYEFGKGQMVKEFEDASFALEVGEVSEPIESSFGYHIIKREAINLTDEKLDEYASTEKQILLSDKLQKAYDEWKSSAKIKISDKALAKVEVIK